MPPGDEAAIRRAWRRMGGHDPEIDALLARYREPHRRYHGVPHVARVLHDVERLLVDESTTTSPLDGDAVRVAALYHDVIYDPTATDNEARSADLAVDVLTALGWAEDRTSLVRRLILATATHTVPEDDIAAAAATAVLLDADLAVLGAEPAVYDAYVRGVRAEYAHVDDEGWRRGRSAVLRSFLDRDVIYRTPAFRIGAERRARANLQAELAGLTR